MTIATEGRPECVARVGFTRDHWSPTLRSAPTLICKQLWLVTSLFQQGSECDRLRENLLDSADYIFGFSGGDMNNDDLLGFDVLSDDCLSGRLEQEPDRKESDVNPFLV